MKNLIRLFVIIVALFLCGCSRQKVLFVSDPVFSRLFKAGNSRALNGFLAKQGMALTTLHAPFDIMKDAIIGDRTFSESEIIVVSPALHSLYLSISDTDKSKSVIKIDEAYFRPVSLKNLEGLLKSSRSLLNRKYAVFTDELFRESLDEALSSIFPVAPSVFYWSQQSADAALSSWLGQQDGISSVIFFSEGVPLSTLKTVFAMLDVDLFIHDLVDTSLLDNLQTHKPGQVIYIGENYPDLLIYAIRDFLSAAESD